MRWLFASFALPVTILFSTWLALPYALKPIMASWLEPQGFLLEEVTIERPTLNHFQILSLSLYQPHLQRTYTLNDIYLQYVIPDLLNTEVHSLAIDSIKVVDKLSPSFFEADETSVDKEIISEVLPIIPLSYFSIRHFEYSALNFLIQGHVNGQVIDQGIGGIKINGYASTPGVDLEFNGLLTSPQLFNLHFDVSKSELQLIHARLGSYDLTKRLLPFDAITGTVKVKGTLDHANNKSSAHLVGQFSNVSFQHLGISIDGLSLPFDLTYSGGVDHTIKLLSDNFSIKKIQFPPLGAGVSLIAKNLSTKLQSTLQQTESNLNNPTISVQIEECQAELLGGQVSVDKFKFPVKDHDSMTIDFVGVEVPELLSVIGSEQLTMSGTIDGRLPFIFQDDNTRVKNGWVKARSPGGHLAVKSGISEFPHEVITQTLAVLSDFYYQSLRSNIEFSSKSGTLILKTNLLGYNPDSMEGKQISLNLTIEEILSITLE